MTEERLREIESLVESQSSATDTPQTITVPEFMVCHPATLRELLSALREARGQTDVEACGATAEEQKDWYYLATEFQACEHPRDCVLTNGDGDDYCPLCHNERRTDMLSSMYRRERDRAKSAEETGYRRGVQAAIAQVKKIRGNCTQDRAVHALCALLISGVPTETKPDGTQN